MKYKAMPKDTNIRSKIAQEKKQVYTVTKEEANKYLKNRKLKRISTSDSAVTISLTDGRRVVVSLAKNEYRIKRKVGSEWVCMTARELEELNYQLETSYKKMVKSIPQECKPCALSMKAEDFL
jgi:hypothetical protein